MSEIVGYCEDCQTELTEDDIYECLDCGKVFCDNCSFDHNCQLDNQKEMQK